MPLSATAKASAMMELHFPFPTGQGKSVDLCVAIPVASLSTVWETFYRHERGCRGWKQKQAATKAAMLELGIPIPKELA